MAHAQVSVSLKLILKNTEGKILALEAQGNGPMADYYDIPGGRIDEEEIGIPFTEIFTRELQEELGDVKFFVEPRPITALTWTWPNGKQIAYVYYEGLLISGEPKISEEHLSSKWINLNETEINKHFTTFHKSALLQYISH